MKIETAEDLECIVDQQNRAIVALDERVKVAEARVELLVALVDGHHDLFVAHGWAKARPIEKTPPVN